MPRPQHGFGRRIERAAQQVPAVAAQHVQQSAASPSTPRPARVKPRGRPSTPLLSIRTSASDAVSVICPRPWRAGSSAPDRRPGSPGCQAQPVRPPRSALTQPTVAVTAADIDRAAQQMPAVGGGNLESAPSRLRERGPGSRGGLVLPMRRTDHAPSPGQRRTSPARRPRARWHRPARRMPDRARAAAAPRRAPRPHRQHRPAAGARSPAPARPRAHRLSALISANRCRRAHVVVAEAGGGQRQRQRLVPRRQTAGTIQPAARLRAVARRQPPPGRARTPRSAQAPRGSRRFGQRPTACGVLPSPVRPAARRQGRCAPPAAPAPAPAPARRGRGRSHARRRGRARGSGPASSGHRRARAPPRHWNQRCAVGRSVGTSWPPPCIAPIANMAPTWPRPAAFSNSASAPGWSFGPPRPVSIISASWTSASTMPTSAARLIQARPSSRIGVHAAPFDQHAAVPVLRVHHAIGGAAQPFGRLAVVALDADAFGQADAEIERRHQVAGGGGLLEPLAGADRVVGAALAAAAAGWRDRPAPSGRPPRPRRGTSWPPPRRPAARRRRSGAACPAPAPPPRWPASAARRNHIAASAIVRRQLAALGVEVADHRRRLRDRRPARRGAARTRLRPDWPATVRPSISAMPQRAWLGRLPFSAAWRNNWIAAARSAGIAHATLGHHARADRAPSADPASAARRRFSATCACCSGVVALRASDRAKPRRPAGSRRRPSARTSDAPRPGRAWSPARGQDVAEHRLAVGRAALGRLARPVEAGLEVRRRRVGCGEQPARRVRCPVRAIRPWIASVASCACAST